MPERQLKLTKPWAKRPAGTILTVHQGVDALTPTTIDPKRAAQLLADGLAVEHLAPAKPAAPAATPKTATKPEVTRG